MAMKKRFIIAVLTLFFTGGLYDLTGQRIDRIEPPFWWEGMEHPQLQLMVHGPDIATFSVHIPDSTLTLLSVTRGASPNYLFLDLDISFVKNGNYTIHFNKGDLSITHEYQFKQRKPGSVNRKGFDGSDVLYLITPDRFANGDPANDEVDGLKEGWNRMAEYGRHGGDIRGIINNLDYIADLGFTAIWLNPVLENDQPEWSYHGYATTDYYKVDPRFGSNEEYLELSRKAQEKGLGLIMDMIENHCGSEHWWMQDFPFSDWINFQDEGFKGTNHQRMTNHDPYGSRIDRKMMTDGWFVPQMPDLNQRNPFMSEYLIQNSIWWIEYADLMGIRQDTYSYPEPSFMSEWTCRIMKEYPQFNIVGEEWTVNHPTLAYWQRDKVNHDGYTSCLPGLMDFPLNAVLADAMVLDEQWNQGFIKIYECLTNDFIYAHPEDFVIFPDNHDMSRIYKRVNGDDLAFELANAFILTTRGIPQMYYGTEIKMTHPGSDSHGVIRSDFPGGWEGDEVNAFTGTGLSDLEKNAQDFIRKLLQWRKSEPAIHEGELMHYIPQENTYVYFRYTPAKTIMVVLNKNKEPYNLHLDRFTERIKNAETFRNVLSDETVQITDQLILPKPGAYIYELVD